MGSLFSNLTKANTAADFGGKRYVFNSPEQATAAASRALPSAGAMLGPDVLNPDMSAPEVPQLAQPTFGEAQGTPGALTKRGKLLSILEPVIQGGIVGWGAPTPSGGYVRAQEMAAWQRQQDIQQQTAQLRNEALANDIAMAPLERRYRQALIDSAQAEIPLRKAQTQHTLALVGAQKQPPQPSLASLSWEAAGGDQRAKSALSLMRPPKEEKLPTSYAGLVLAHESEVNPLRKAELGHAIERVEAHELDRRGKADSSGSQSAKDFGREVSVFQAKLLAKHKGDQQAAASEILGVLNSPNGLDSHNQEIASQALLNLRKGGSLADVILGAIVGAGAGKQ